MECWNEQLVNTDKCQKDEMFQGRVFQSKNWQMFLCLCAKPLSMQTQFDSFKTKLCFFVFYLKILNCFFVPNLFSCNLTFRSHLQFKCLCKCLIRLHLKYSASLFLPVYGTKSKNLRKKTEKN